MLAQRRPEVVLPLGGVDQSVVILPQGVVVPPQSVDLALPLVVGGQQSLIIIIVIINIIIITFIIMTLTCSVSLSLVLKLLPASKVAARLASIVSVLSATVQHDTDIYYANQIF